MLLLCALIVGSSSAWADTNISTVATSFSATGDVTSKFTQTGDFTQSTWNLNVTWGSGGASWQNMNDTKGSQIGSGSKPATQIVLTGSNIPGTITSVKVNSSVASGGSTTVGVTVGNTAFSCNNNATATLQTSPADYDFTGSASGNVVLTWNQASTSKAIYIKSITITYTTSGGSTPSISANNVDIAYNAEEGEIAYTINNPVEGGELTASTEDSWIVPDDATASTVPFICDTNDGAKRTATITLTYTYDTDKTVTKNVTVTQAAGPNAPGTENNPYTVAQARAAIDAGTGVNDVYAKGYVSTTGTVNSSGAINYFISSDGSKTADQLEAYKGKGINGADFTSDDDIQLGDLVVIKGNLKKYNSTYEFDEGNQLVSLKRIQMIDLIKDCPLTFVEGSEFNHDGLKVIAIYEDESTLDVTALSEIEEPDMTKIGPQTVLVNYGMFQTGYEITITEKPTHTATFSVNGTTSTNNFKEGTDIEFPEVTAPTGYTFMGWTETELTEPQATAPDYITLPVAMGTSDVTYYAVFAKISGTPASLTKMVAGDTFSAGDNVVIVANVDENTAYALYQETQSNSYVKNYLFTPDVETIGSDNKNWLTVSAGTDGKWKLGDATNGYLYNSSSNNLSVDTSNSTEWTLEDNNDGTFRLKGARYVSCRTDLQGDNQYLFRMAGGTPAGVYAFDIYKYVAGSGTYFDYCTTVLPPVEITISAAGWASFSNASEVEIPEGVTAYYAQKKDDATVTLKEITGGYIPANTGVIVSGGANTYEATVTATGATLEEDNLLKPWLTAGEPEETTDYYTLAVNSENKPIFKKSTGGPLAAGKAYLVMPAGAGARELSISFDEEGNTTAIDVISKTEDVRGEVYNLNGQRVAQPTKGLYIVNGKKVVMK